MAGQPKCGEIGPEGHHCDLLTGHRFEHMAWMATTDQDTTQVVYWATVPGKLN